jgi:hypothetical protein
MTQYLKIERGGLVNTRHIQFIIPCENDQCFAVTNHLGLEALEVDSKFYAGFMLEADYQTVCLILGDSDE